ncbi:hypothetical protein B0H13DRAFT_1996620 [Mycena leptocephala]|nr:hypothetical protein B0H13DRAFT_1996620 [Mycena leptocephala]
MDVADLRVSRPRNVTMPYPRRRHGRSCLHKSANAVITQESPLKYHRHSPPSLNPLRPRANWGPPPTTSPQLCSATRPRTDLRKTTLPETRRHICILDAGWLPDVRNLVGLEVLPGGTSSVKMSHLNYIVILSVGPPSVSIEKHRYAVLST